MTDTSLKGPGSLAFLVNESRARRPDLSHDYFARFWPDASQQQAISALWKDFSRTVYSNDDIELSVRNRYILENALDFFREGSGTILNIAAGLTSYSYSMPPGVTCVELDLSEVISFKQQRVRELISQGYLPRRKVVFQTLDLEGDISSLEPTIISAKGPTLIVMEGISYYLSPAAWGRLVDLLGRPGPTKDYLIIFDFWRKADATKSVFERFRQFCRRQTGQKIGKFNHLDFEPGQKYGSLVIEDVSNVFAEERRFGEGILRPGASNVMPEYYAIARLGESGAY